MSLKRGATNAGDSLLTQITIALLILCGAGSCARPHTPTGSYFNDDAANLAREVKEFAQSLGVEASAALSQTASGGNDLSMVWLWLQKVGTVAVRAPMDIKMAIGFGAAMERIPLEQVYRVDGYSVYYRQGNEFADPRANATPSFAAEEKLRQVQVIIHEDLHADRNFALPWEIEEAVVTPLGALLTVEFFRQKGDRDNLTRALESVEEGRKVSRELTALAAAAEKIFMTTELNQAREQILSFMARYPDYERRFRQQTKGQHVLTVLEAKLSHDLAYLRYFDALASLPNRRGGLKTLIQDLKKLPRGITHEMMDQFLGRWSSQNTAGGDSPDP